MKTICILLVIFGIAAAKPHENVNFDDAKFDGMLDEIMKEMNDEAHEAQEAPSVYPSEIPQAHTTSEPRPTKGPHPRPSGMPHPTGKPDGFWPKFFHLLFKKSVEGVKPDEHPDIKYMKPGQELVDQLLNLKKEVGKTLKSLAVIRKLMEEDEKAVMVRVSKALSENNIYKAQYAVGEYFIAIQRRFATLAIQAESKGLFDVLEDKEVANMVKRGIHHVQHLDEASKYVLHYFSQFRVFDGLPDAPFVKLYVAFYKANARVNAIGKTAVRTSLTVYMDLITRMVHHSVDNNDHDAAVHEAGASVLSFARRATKVKIALMRIYAPKKCY